MPRPIATARTVTGDEVEAAVARLAGMTLEELRQEWGRRFRRPPPPWRSLELLRRLLAYRLQEAVYGGLSGEAKRELKRLAARFEEAPGHRPAAAPDRLMPGTELVREWRGAVHRVRVVDERTFEYAGERFGSLSEIARRITGTRWSGPLFFGLKSPEPKQRRRP